MNARDYSEWCEWAGLYVRNFSHADRYRMFQQRISDAGLIACIVHDFLRDCDGGIDVQRWRNFDVYEPGAEATFRIEQTARALEAIGAPRLAKKVRRAENKTLLATFMKHANDPEARKEIMKQGGAPAMMEEIRTSAARAMPELAAKAGVPAEKKPVGTDAEIEPWERVEYLLEQFVRDHQQDLLADLEKYGDPRAEPGFDPARRKEELDRMARREWDIQTQGKEVSKMRDLMGQLERQVARNPSTRASKLLAFRREIMQCYRQYARRPRDELVPEMQRWLDDAVGFQAKYASVFRLQPVTDERLLKRLAEIGTYYVDSGEGGVEFSWDSPKGLQCEWTKFSLSLRYPAKKKKSPRRLLDAYDRLRKRFAREAEDLRRQVLESFQESRVPAQDWEQEWELEGYERDEQGDPTERSILENAGDGQISISIPDDADDDTAVISVYFPVEWDSEHGLELFISDEPDEEPAETVAAASKITFHDSGPSLSSEDIAAFEKKHELRLPAEYREFLLAHNGGRPEPDHLKATVDASSVPLDVDRLFFIAPAGTAEDENSLGTAVTGYRRLGVPSNSLPIGRVFVPNPMGGQRNAPLFLALSGRKEGKVLVGFLLPGVAPEGAADGACTPDAVRLMAQFSEGCCHAVAAGFSAFLARLIEKPLKPDPDWLKAIGDGDVARFVAWVESGGNLKERYAPYGGMFLLTVVDYLSKEGAPEFLKALLDRKIVKPKQLRDSWLQLGCNLARFKQLMPLLAKDQWRYAFASPEIWDDPALLDQLVEAGVDLEGSIDNEGSTPLHRAARGLPDGVRWLLARGVAPGKPDKFGRTPMTWAENGNQLECFKLLVEAGVSWEELSPHMPTVKDKLRWLKSRWFDKFDALADYLRSRGVNVDI